MKIARWVEDITIIENVISVQTNDVEIRVSALTEDILRIRAGFDGDFTEESYDLTMTAWPDLMDDYMVGYRRRVSLVDVNIGEENDSVSTFTMGHFMVEIHHNPFLLQVLDLEGNILHEDIEKRGWMLDSNNRRIHASVIETGDHFYGFGERTGHLNKKGKLMTFSPGDCMGYDPIETDPLYKHIPFYIKLNDRTKRAVGYFYHNTYECDFNMGRSHSNYVKHHSIYRTDGGDIDLFLIAGPKVRDVIRRYTDLTGKSAMLPKAALGYLGSSMYYAELPKDADQGIIDFVDTAKKEDIPVDGFQLSSGYCNIATAEGLKRCTFTWNRDRFSDPEKFFAEMDRRGITVSPNVKPAMLLCHPLNQEMAARGLFVKDSKEEVPAIGLWWGGDGNYVDFTSAANRETWKKYLTENVLDYGATSIWNDNCEYDGVTDKDARVCFEGKGATVGQVKSEMANIMCHVAVEAIKESYPNTRPFVVCRSGHAGIQRYAQTWAGDNYTSWESLRYNIATILGMSLSGVANQGCDIGGFYGSAPEEELLLRWVQNGIFQPRFSIHSTNTDNTVTEAWMYENTKKYVVEAIKLRYRLMPYLYSLMRRAAVTGLPIMEPLLSAYQDDVNVYDEDVNFMEGDSLLVANVVIKGATTREIYFPEGYRFYDYRTYEKYEGGKIYELPVDISSIPMFIKEGGIVTESANQIYNLSNEKITDLKIICAPLENSDEVNVFELYDDDGKTMNYEKGEYSLTEINMSSGEVVTLQFKTCGDYVAPVENIFIDMIHKKSCPYSVEVDGDEITHFTYKEKFDESLEGWYYDMTLGCVKIKYPKNKDNYDVKVDFRNKDLLGM
ncbi:MAG: DUF4968 domain-containing protein [Lachnospiraceae bacterium]|nr:DUF4968 domain-containing protein [Lachnospiraceae bacterium]